ncbi:hypothetical protein C1H46_003067 [Malus baccata]|uniref:Methyltransferase type 11 domain-containing protein n=1 Tax=Malus baccata TaxID=106549 RepID=A0A540NL16_MALBA|nr:hypothetical protein C1H46_003067 [Malus baccata]
MAISMLYGAQNLKLVNGIIAVTPSGLGYGGKNYAYGGTTLGIVKHVDAKNVTILDQSPHQLAKAKENEPLKECRKIEGDVEDLPYPIDYVDRYVSTGRQVYIKEQRPNNIGLAARGIFGYRKKINSDQTSFLNTFYKYHTCLKVQRLKYKIKINHENLKHQVQANGWQAWL